MMDLLDVRNQLIAVIEEALGVEITDAGFDFTKGTAEFDVELDDKGYAVEIRQVH